MVNASDGGQSCRQRLWSGSPRHDLPVYLGYSPFTGLRVFSPFTENQSRFLSLRPILARPSASYDILSVLGANAHYRSTATPPFVKGLISGNKVVLRSRCDLVDHRHTCCRGRKTHLCTKLLKMKEMSEQGEKLILEGTKQDGVINFNLHCTTPRVIYLRVRSVRERRLGRHTLPTCSPLKPQRCPGSNPVSVIIKSADGPLN